MFVLLFNERKTTKNIEIEKHFFFEKTPYLELGQSGIFSVDFLVMSLGLIFFAHHFGFVMLKFFEISGFVLVLWFFEFSPWVVTQILESNIIQIIMMGTIKTMISFFLVIFPFLFQ